MNILITGGLGFIGSNLAKRLSKDNHNITIIDSLIPQYGGNFTNIKDFRETLNINIADMRDEFALRELLKNKDIIFNLAAQTSHQGSMEEPFIDLDINSKSQLSLLEIAKEVCPEVVIVYTSTRQIYGKPKYLPVDEKHPIRPVDINGVNKLAGEQFHLLYNDVYGLKTICLRLTNTYGPCMRIKDARQTFLGVWVRNLILGNPILVFGDGTQKRDFNYVDDVVDALILASRSEKSFGKTINLGSSEIIPLEELAKKLCKMYPGGSYKLVPFPEKRKAIDIGNYYGDFKLATNLMNWQPKIKLNDGLQKTLSFYQKFYSEYI